MSAAYSDVIVGGNSVENELFACVSVHAKARLSHEYTAMDEFEVNEQNATHIFPSEENAETCHVQVEEKGVIGIIEPPPSLE